MKKQRHLDFLIEQNNKERLIFRFYPRKSSCHSFGDNPPTSWADVYKVYYSYAIIRQDKYYSDEEWKSEVMFKEPCDECSIIDDIAKRCFLLADGQEIWERKNGTPFSLLDNPVLPFGMGTEWTISKRSWNDFEDEETIHTYFDFTLFNYNNRGFRFSIPKEKIRAFGEYLQNCCEYMLAHGNSI